MVPGWIRSLWMAPLGLVACVSREPPDGTAATRPSVQASGVTQPWRPGGQVSTGVGGRAGTDPRRDLELRGTYVDHFDRSLVGADYRTTSPNWNIEDGQLCVKDARNHPLWLKRRLPENAQINFTAVSHSIDGDIKCEAWGDGEGSADKASYVNATSYLFILGGWKNSLHVLARLDEHGHDRLSLAVTPDSAHPRTLPVAPGKLYRFVIERRDGKTVRWVVDQVEILRLVDPNPLAGIGHDHFAFNDWATQVCFDDLVVTPLPSDAP